MLQAKRKQPKRAPKVIEIRDEEESAASYKAKRTKKATSTNQKVADIINKATSQKVVEVNKNTVTAELNSGMLRGRGTRLYRYISPTRYIGAGPRSRYIKTRYIGTRYIGIRHIG